MGLVGVSRDRNIGRRSFSIWKASGLMLTDSGSQGRRGSEPPAASILDGHPSKRIADKCARLYRPFKHVALRRGRETYETAALPLSYVGADEE
jgi:hypothetical protein